MDLVVRASAVFFSAAGPADGGGGHVGWGAVFARLIAAGHPPSALTGYTARQLKLFHAEALVLQNEVLADRIQAAALGMGGKDLPEIVDKLRRRPAGAKG